MQPFPTFLWVEGAPPPEGAPPVLRRKLRLPSRPPPLTAALLCRGRCSSGVTLQDIGPGEFQRSKNKKAYADDIMPEGQDAFLCVLPLHETKGSKALQLPCHDGRSINSWAIDNASSNAQLGIVAQMRCC